MSITGCILLAAHLFNIPAAALLGIYSIEQGTPGLEQPNTNGTSDLGPMQINTLWVPVLAKKTGQPESVVQELLISNRGCFNVMTAAWILRGELTANGGDLFDAVGNYHSRTPHLKQAYQTRVTAAFTKTINRMTNNTSDELADE